MDRAVTLKLPWTDRAGRLDRLKLAVFLACVAPGIWIAFAFSMGWLMPKPVTEAIHEVGDWAVRFLIASLAVTPLRRLAQWGRLIVVRRMLGVTALAYVLIHLSLYVVDQHFVLLAVVSEIARRFYLTIGFVALCGLVALGVTSTDAMIRRLGGPRWSRLHALVYAISVLALVHFFLQSKIDVSKAVLMTGFFFWLMGWRLLQRRSLGTNSFALFGLAFAAALATALTEAAWYAGKTGADATMVLMANVGIDFDQPWLDLATGLRPAAYVLLAGLALCFVHLARSVRWRREATVGRGVAVERA
jgi:sulfoxide reductase heme-binding subunit YedZ